MLPFCAFQMHVFRSAVCPGLLTPNGLVPAHPSPAGGVAVYRSCECFCASGVWPRGVYLKAAWERSFRRCRAHCLDIGPQWVPLCAGLSHPSVWSDAVIHICCGHVGSQYALGNFAPCSPLCPKTASALLLIILAGCPYLASSAASLHLLGGAELAAVGPTGLGILPGFTT